MAEKVGANRLWSRGVAPDTQAVGGLAKTHALYFWVVNPEELAENDNAIAVTEAQAVTVQ